MDFPKWYTEMPEYIEGKLHNSKEYMRKFDKISNDFIDGRINVKQYQQEVEKIR